MKFAIALFIAVMLPLAALAQTSPVGTWKTIDDATGKPRSLVRIVDVNGELRGTIEKLFLRPDEKEGAVCEKCSDERKGKPILGMEIMRGYKKTADVNKFDSGQILDPNNGKTYRSNLTLIEEGRKLQMRGYIGPFSRAQIWVRDE
jgi:uncharacterized protein (DUF2147 family)